jgi:hypothetical protein
MLFSALSMRWKSITLIFVSMLVCLANTGARASGGRFEVSFPAATHSQPVTGRVFVFVTRHPDPEPRLQEVGDHALLFGKDVNELKAGQPVFLTEHTLGYPLKSLAEIPAGDYYLQGVLNVYTEFHRSDGHTIWAHMDQWEGQQFNLSPGNLFSEPVRAHLDASTNYDLKISLNRVIPPIEIPSDTGWVKHIKIQSTLLSRFWGRPIWLGATVLLPKGYDSHPEAYYPVVYNQTHFTLQAPFGFETKAPPKPEAKAEESRYEFREVWDSDRFPRMIAVNFLHPTPYFDDSYGVNSANNGPYGDAILTELIPYLEQHFRMIRKPYARVLTGGSTGGWESIALQILHPEFFGGTWTFFPDPVDFRRYGMVNIYEDENAFVEPKHEWMVPERPLMRSPEGQVQITMRQFSQMEEVLGSHGRSAQQLEAWEAVYGPVGDDGYPRPLWNKLSGQIDHEVAHYMREHGYDLRFYLEANWPRVGNQLVDKLHVYCGDMDHFYLNLAVYLMEDYLKTTTNPPYGGSFEYGRPMKGHGWHPMSYEQLIRDMAEHILKAAPASENTAQWNY